jgi:predicted membrane protein
MAMFGKLMRAISFLLLGWFVFIVGAVIYAATRRREALPQDPASDEVDLVATFGPLEFHSESGAFKGGTVTTWFGGGTLDLRDATLDPAGATLQTSALFGGGNLIVPETWNVETKIVGIGGAGDGRPNVERPADAPVLRLEGTAIFGGWGITSEAPGEDHREPVIA